MIDLKTNIHIKFLISFCILVHFCLNTAFPLMAAENLLPERNSREILKQLSFTESENETAKKWVIYLEEHTWFNDEVHQKAILEAGLEFASSLSALDDCTKEMEHQQEQYSSNWIRYFRKEFDRAYIVKNMDSIKFVISCMYARNNLKFCEEQKKDALYREILYRQALEDYMQLLRRFSETLNKKERDKIEERLNIARTFLHGHPYPLQVLLSPGRQMLFPIALKTRNDIDPRLVKFFTQNSFFRKPFDQVKTVDDLTSETVGRKN